MPTTFPQEILQSEAFRALLKQAGAEREQQRSALGRELAKLEAVELRDSAARAKAQAEADATFKKAQQAYDAARGVMYNTSFRLTAEGADVESRRRSLRQQMARLADPVITRALEHVEACRNNISHEKATLTMTTARLAERMRRGLQAYHAIQALMYRADVDVHAEIARILADAGLPGLDD